MKTNFFLWFFALFQIAYSQQLVDGIMAVVGDDAILQSDVLQSAQLQAMQDNVNLNTDSYMLDRYMENSLNSLINQYVIYQVAEEDTLISVSDEELDAALDQQVQGMLERAGSKELLEETLGKPLKKVKKDYRDELKKLMFIDKYQQKFYQEQDVTRTEVVDFYETYKDSIPASLPQSKFSLIEIPITPGIGSQNQAVGFLNQLLDSLHLGVDFSVLAERYSDDSGTAEFGGDLGFIERGTLVREYEEAAYSLKVGEVSAPIKTEYGYHLIQLIDKQGEKVRTRHILKKVLPSAADRQTALGHVKDIFAEIEASPASFDSLAMIYMKENKNLSGVYGWKNDADIGSEILDLLAGATAEGYTYPYETENNSFMLAFLYDRKESIKPSLENAWDHIEQLALQYKINDQFQKWINKTREGVYVKVF